jgi:hypothetical protein
MNRALEFHDSQVASVTGSDSRVVVSFSQAYIHCSHGKPGVAAGEGHVQAARLSFGRATWMGDLSQARGVLSDGSLHVDGIVLSLVPLPYTATGIVRAEFTFVSGARLSVAAASVMCATEGQARGVEPFLG